VLEKAGADENIWTRKVKETRESRRLLKEESVLLWLLLALSLWY